ncbi:MAG: sugar phosphate isomerase/epimerase [Treponema sp.]|nr:sugar phosphate isomerase/epimerase [Treponema sp.]
MKIGVQTYTVREYLKDEKGIESSLRRIKEIGFNMVQLSGLGPCNIDKLAGWIKEIGIEVCGSHDPWERLSEPAELKKLIEEYKKLGASHVGIGMMPGVFPNTYDGYSAFIKKVKEICKQIAGEGMSFGYHNHDFEFQKFNGTRAIDRLIDECPDLYFILDVFWVQAGGRNPCEYIEKLKGRIKLIHFKDYRVADRKRQFAEIGEGNLEWDKIVPLCEKNGIPWAVIEQDADYLSDPFQSLALSRKFLADGGWFTQS